MFKKIKNTPEELKQRYEYFWKDILENPDGSINKEQLYKELSDFEMLMNNVTKIYMLATGNKVSYNTTLPETVFELFEQELSDSYDDGYQDAMDNLED